MGQIHNLASAKAFYKSVKKLPIQSQFDALFKDLSHLADTWNLKEKSAAQLKEAITALLKTHKVVNTHHENLINIFKDYLNSQECTNPHRYNKSRRIPLTNFNLPVPGFAQSSTENLKACNLLLENWKKEISAAQNYLMPLQNIYRAQSHNIFNARTLFFFMLAQQVAFALAETIDPTNQQHAPKTNNLMYPQIKFPEYAAPATAIITSILTAFVSVRLGQKRELAAQQVAAIIRAAGIDLFEIFLDSLSQIRSKPSKPWVNPALMGAVPLLFLLSNYYRRIDFFKIRFDEAIGALIVSNRYSGMGKTSHQFTLYTALLTGTYLVPAITPDHPKKAEEFNSQAAINLTVARITATLFPALNYMMDQMGFPNIWAVRFGLKFLSSLLFLPLKNRYLTLSLGAQSIKDFFYTLELPPHETWETFSFAIPPLLSFLNFKRENPGPQLYAKKIFTYEDYGKLNLSPLDKIGFKIEIRNDPLRMLLIPLETIMLGPKRNKKPLLPENKNEFINGLSDTFCNHGLLVSNDNDTLCLNFAQTWEEKILDALKPNLQEFLRAARKLVYPKKSNQQKQIELILDFPKDFYSTIESKFKIISKDFIVTSNNNQKTLEISFPQDKPLILSLASKEYRFTCGPFIDQAKTIFKRHGFNILQAEMKEEKIAAKASGNNSPYTFSLSLDASWEQSTAERNLKTIFSEIFAVANSLIDGANETQRKIDTEDERKKERAQRKAEQDALKAAQAVAQAAAAADVKIYKQKREEQEREQKAEEARQKIEAEAKHKAEWQAAEAQRKIEAAKAMEAAKKEAAAAAAKAEKEEKQRVAQKNPRSQANKQARKDIRNNMLEFAVGHASAITTLLGLFDSENHENLNNVITYLALYHHLLKFLEAMKLCSKNSIEISTLKNGAAHRGWWIEPLDLFDQIKNISDSEINLHEQKEKPKDSYYEIQEKLITKQQKEKALKKYFARTKQDIDRWLIEPTKLSIVDSQLYIKLNALFEALVHKEIDDQKEIDNQEDFANLFTQLIIETGGVLLKDGGDYADLKNIPDHKTLQADKAKWANNPAEVLKAHEEGTCKNTAISLEALHKLNPVLIDALKPLASFLGELKENLGIDNTLFGKCIPMRAKTHHYFHKKDTLAECAKINVRQHFSPLEEVSDILEIVHLARRYARQNQLAVDVNQSEFVKKINAAAKESFDVKPKTAQQQQQQFPEGGAAAAPARVAAAALPVYVYASPISQPSAEEKRPEALPEKEPVKGSGIIIEEGPTRLTQFPPPP